MHPGGAGTPPAGGGSGAPRLGPARPGQGRGPPRLMPGALPVEMGTPSPNAAPAPDRRPRRIHPSLAPAQPCRIDRPDPGVPLNTGCPYGAGSPWHSREPPGQTAEDHRARPGPPPAHRGGVKQTLQYPAPLPQPLPSPASPTQPPAAQQAQAPHNPRAGSHPGCPQPACPQAPTCASCPAPTQAPPTAASPVLWSSLGATLILLPSPWPPRSGPCTRVCMCLYTCAHCTYLQGCGGTGVRCRKCP